MAEDRLHVNARGSAHDHLSKDDLPLSATRPGSFMRYIDERYPQLEKRWTASQPGLEAKDSGEIMRKMLGGRCIKIEAVQPPANKTNWNDIPEEMLNSPSRGTKPKNKAEAVQRRQSRRQKIANRQKNMAERHQNPSGDKDLDTKNIMQQAQNAQELDSPMILTLNRVVTIKPDPHVQKFKLKRGINPSNMSQTLRPNSYTGELTVSILDDAEDINEHSEGSEDIEVCDFEDIDFEDIGNSSGATSGHRAHLGDDEKPCSRFDILSGGLDSGNGGTETEHDSTKVDIATCSIHNHPDMDDEEFDYNWLQAKEAAGEPIIFPKDMLEKLRAKVKANEEQRRKKDPRYQHDLLMAKVNVAQAKREAELSHEVLYPEPVHREKCYVDMEDWDLLEDFEVKYQLDEEDETELGITSSSDNELDGNVIASLDPKQVAQSVPKRTIGRLEAVYGLASKAGKIFPSKPAPKQVEELGSVDCRNVGWTLADLLVDDGERMIK